MILVDGLEKVFGQRKVLKGVSFVAPNRAITGILGANGAGKTTLLRILAGALRPSAGTGEIDGISISNRGEIKGHLGSLLDHTGIYARLTARENLAYYGRLRQLEGAELDNLVESTLKMLGLHHVSDVPVAGFSQGERMKVALGRVILDPPQNLLLDEPTNALDIMSIRSLRSLLKRMRDDGQCLIFCSHVLEDVQALCDRIVILSDGVIAVEGTVEEICDATRTSNLEEAFVAATSHAEIVQ